METQQTQPLDTTTYFASIDQLKRDVAALFPKLINDQQTVEMAEMAGEHEALLAQGGGIERILLPVQLSLLLLRGASVADIEHYTATGDRELPFEGAEQAMYDALMNYHAELLGNCEKVARGTASIVGYLDRVRSMFEEHLGYSRLDLSKIICGEMSYV